MQRDKQGNDVPAEPDSMQQADVVNGEHLPDAHADNNAERSGQRQAEENADNEPPA